jgi:hypothetical protein
MRNLMMNNKIKNAADYIASVMPSVNNQYSNPIETLDIIDIIYLQKYLEQIKVKKIEQMNQQQREVTNNTIPQPRFASQQTEPNYRENDVVARCGSLSQQNDSKIDARGTMGTRQGRRIGSEEVSLNRNNWNLNQNSQSTGIDFHKSAAYNNPYEYGGRDNSLGPLYKEAYVGSYQNDSSMCSNMGLTPNQTREQPNHIRNIDIESSLLQHEMTHIPGQRQLTEKDFNRFELLPFDPQDHRHIVWTDNMPRGGYNTRSDRLEYQ